MAALPADNRLPSDGFHTACFATVAEGGMFASTSSSASSRKRTSGAASLRWSPCRPKRSTRLSGAASSTRFGGSASRKSVVQQRAWSELDPRRRVAAGQRPCLQRTSLHRDRIGRHTEDRAEGGPVRALVPDSIPSVPPLRLGGQLQTLAGTARLAKGGHRGPLLPNPGLFAHGCVREEALLSLRINGTRSSRSDPPGFERGTAPRFPAQ